MRDVRQILLSLALLCSVAACTWISIKPDDALAQRVYMNGEFEYLQADVVAATVAPHLGVPLSQVDLRAVAQALRELPWLAEVSVDRHWPDGVVLHVSEHEPLARWGDGKVLTRDFTVIAPPAAAVPASLPQLAGPEGTGERVYTRFQQMNAQLAAASDRHIAELALDARGSWQATLADGLQLRLGRKHLAARLQRFIDYALAEVPGALAEAGYVDLRYSDGFAVGGMRAATALERVNEQEA
ncbi:MAG TPA: cell division protein FtsQ/DivIB [Salinisphaeraceae bacterium]|nr:cell division protein FtsQ/DivIB [Salinisphaeraceae bacterium]